MLNHGYRYQNHLDQRSRGHTTLSYLVWHFQHSDQETWLQRLSNGEVLLDDKIANGHEVLCTGSILSWNRPPWVEAETPQHYDVIYQDTDVLVVSKPSGLPTMPAGGFLVNTLLSLVRKTFSTASPLHRLGRGTSGLVIFSLNANAHFDLSKQWRKQSVAKHYLALASGLASQDMYTITMPIGLVNHPRLGTIYAASQEGKKSLSIAKVLERKTNSTLFDVAIKTGRPHQIRIHLASIGYPLVGDILYGLGGLPISDVLPGEGGYFLHAQKLEVLHPSSRELLTFDSPLPKDFEDMLEKH
jgi:23S rRNA pseudouridine1911/1915/1917 synthase